ncbi:hypothetical protein PMIN03_004323 [Paraphaeosphaeria minitans]
MRSNVHAKLEKAASRRVTFGAVFRFGRAWVIEVQVIGAAAKGVEALARAKVQERNAQYSRAVVNRPSSSHRDPAVSPVADRCIDPTTLSFKSVLVSLFRYGRQCRGGIATRTSPCREEEPSSARRLVLGATTQQRSPRTSPGLQK